MFVRFSDQDEFVADLVGRQDAVAGRMVRTTTNRRPGAQAGVTTRLAVVATAKVLNNAVRVADADDYDLVRYEEVTGYLWGQAENDDQVTARTTELIESLEAKLAAEGFRIGHGVYELAEA